MAFEITDETYFRLPGEDPRKWGYIEGYPADCEKGNMLRINVKEIPDEHSYNCYKVSNCLDLFEYKPGKPYGTTIRLTRKQVVRLIWELLKWLVKGY